ncbi:hypothetical protein G9A89_018819 [Geosiphon pyriformis]|nr:hypothetical protein G9A89_018819 [Geosiphon pyriformis]
MKLAILLISSALIYTYCKQRFNISDGIEIVKKTLYQYIENCINNYFLENYNILEVRSNLYNNLVHYLQLRIEDLNSETLATYFQELNFNIIKYCEKTYSVQFKYFIDFKSETKTSNKGKQKLKQHLSILNTPKTPKTTAKHLQTSEQRTSVKLPLSITPFSILLAQPQTPNLLFNYFSRPEDYYKETELEQEKTTENKEKIATAYIAKIPEFTETAEEWFENLEEPFGNWQAFKNINSQRKLKTILQTNNNSSNHKDTNHHNNTTKTILNYHPTTNLKIVIIVESQDTGNEIARNCKEINKTEVINITLHYNKLITNLHHQLITHQDHKIKTITINQLHNQCSNNISNFCQFSKIKHHPLNNIKYQPEDCEVVAPRLNPFNNIIPPAQIAQNANLSDIFSFKFEANESPFLLSNAAVNEQKAITAIGSAGSIITYQLIQQLNQNVDRPAQAVIVIADGMKKTPVGEIDNFLFTIDRITISVKVLVMDAPQYQAFMENDWFLKANANLNWETQKLKILYQGQYTIKKMPFTETYMAFGSTSNWAEETEQEIFEKTKGWKKI